MPKTVSILTKVFCIFCPNAVLLASIGGGLWHGQIQNGVNFYFGVQFVLEGQSQSPHKTIEIFTKLFCITGPNLVILAWISDDLFHGQRIDTRTDRQIQAMAIPWGRNWPQVKTLRNHCHEVKFYTVIERCWIIDNNLEVLENTEAINMKRSATFLHFAPKFLEKIWKKKT